MTAPNYRNGAQLERAARVVLESVGYYVIRSAGSKGAADLVALKPGEVLLVQCKLDGKMPPAEREAFAKLADRLGVVSLIASWHKEGNAARTVRYMYRTPGRESWWVTPWTPDYAIGTVPIRAARMKIGGPTREQVAAWKAKGLIGR